MSLVDRSAHWLSQLVQIPSVTPMQAGPRAGVAGEAHMAQFVADRLASFGAEISMEDVTDGRPNVYATFRGTSDCWIAIDVHIDTVGVEQMEGNPFSGAIHDGKVWGRGAVDTKASLGVVLAMLEDYRQRGVQLAPNLIVAATVDEEVGATGAPAFAAWIERNDLPIQQIIVAEPTLCVPVHGHKGLARCLLTVHGQAAHSSQPEKGKNALMEAVRIALALEQEHTRLQATTASVLGVPKLTVTIMNGGTGINVVPEQCTLGFDRRLIETESAADTIAGLIRIANEVSALPVTYQVLKEIDAYLLSPESEWLHRLEEWTGKRAQTAPYGTNAWAYRNLPCECIVLGPGSVDQAHRAQEWVELSQLAKIEQIYRQWLEAGYPSQ